MLFGLELCGTSLNYAAGWVSRLPQRARAESEMGRLD
jgi:hypothetical protein